MSERPSVENRLIFGGLFLAFGGDPALVGGSCTIKREGDNVVIWYDCPKCGKPNSSDGEHFCGKCEREYQEYEYKMREEQIAQLTQETKTCACQSKGPDEPCGTCYRRYARILSLQGREAEAEAMLNQ